jgi:hypothetical protein
MGSWESETGDLQGHDGEENEIEGSCVDILGFFPIIWNKIWEGGPQLQLSFCKKLCQCHQRNHPTLSTINIQ